MPIVLHIAFLTAVVYLLSRHLPGFRIKNGVTALIVAVVFSVLNWMLGWLLRGMLFLPSLLTLGLLFLFVPFIVNAVILWLTDKILEDFEMKDTRVLLISSGAITVANWLIHFALRHAHV